MEISIFKLFRSFFLVLFITIVEYQRRSFTLSGAVTGFILCLIIAYANIVFLFVMVTFVLSCSFATRYKFDIKQSKINEDDHLVETKKYKNKAARSYIQVLCNGLIACLYAVGYCWKTNYSGVSLPIDNKHESSLYSIGFIFTVACSCGDTLASELGSLAPTNPRLLTNPFRVVPVGTNGGISFAGCLYSLLGGFMVGLSYIMGNIIFCRSDYMINTCIINIQLLLYCTLFGLLGSLIDSLLGATLQFSGYDRERNVTVQKPGPSIEWISGLNILSNNQVNILSSLITSIISILIIPSIMF